MTIRNIELSADEEQALRDLVTQKGHEESALSPANLIRAALGFDLRQRGGARENTGRRKPQKTKRNRKGTNQ